MNLPTVLMHPSAWQQPLIDLFVVVDLVLWGLVLLPLVILARWSLTASCPPVRGVRFLVRTLCHAPTWKNAQNLAGLLSLALIWFTAWGLVTALVGIALQWPYAVQALAGWRKGDQADAT